MATKHELIPIPKTFAKIKTVSYDPQYSPPKQPAKTFNRIELLPIPKAKPKSARLSYVEVPKVKAATTISPVPVPVTPPVSSPEPINRSAYCFMYDRTRRTISLSNAYQSTCKPQQRLSYPHCYIHADSFDHAIELVNKANTELRKTVWLYDADYYQHEQLEATLHQFHGYVHTDEIDALNTPPQKNITAIRRKRSKKSAKGSSQLNAIINHEESKQRNPQASTELDRCKREHRPIKYVAPPPVSTIGPLDHCRTINRLAAELAATAASTLGMPPVPSEIELLEQSERIELELLNKQWLEENKASRIKQNGKVNKPAKQTKPPRIKSKKQNHNYLYPPQVKDGKWCFPKIITK